MRGVKSTKGFTLFEVLLSLFLLTAASFFLFHYSLKSLQLSHAAYEGTMAFDQAQEKHWLLKQRIQNVTQKN